MFTLSVQINAALNVPFDLNVLISCGKMSDKLINYQVSADI